MIDYKEITDEQIDRMNIQEVNKYIESYGRVLLQRTLRIQQAMQSSEQEAAFKYNLNQLGHITNSIGIDNRPRIEGEIEFKNFDQLVLARNRLKNLVASLKSSSSTITGQKAISAKRREGVRDSLKKMGIKHKFSNAELDTLGEIFNLMGHGREQYASDEIIEGYTAVTSDIEGFYTTDELIDLIKQYLSTGKVPSQIEEEGTMIFYES